MPNSLQMLQHIMPRHDDVKATQILRYHPACGKDQDIGINERTDHKSVSVGATTAFVPFSRNIFVV